MPKNSSMDKIIKVIEYVEANVKERIILDNISDHVNLSKYHLNRIFKAITAKQLMDYVRNRKLTYSLNELLDTNLKVIDIAVEYNFQYVQSYIRSFKNAFGISPDKFRKEKPAVKIIDRLDLQLIKAVDDDGIIIDPVFLIKPAFTIVGIEHQISAEDDNRYFVANSVGNEFYYNHRHEIENALYPDNYIGLIRHVDQTMTYTNYVPSLQVSDCKTIPAGMVRYTIPSRKYAVFKYIGLHHPRFTTVASLRDIHRYIFGVWLEKSGYAMSDPYFFESINMDIATDDYCELELYIPVTEKNL